MTGWGTSCAVLRGMGDSRAPFLSVLVCSVVNVALDMLLVAGLRQGTAGAAAGIGALGVRIAFSYAFAQTLGWPVIAFAEAFSWLVLLGLYLLRLAWKDRHEER